MPSAWLPLTDQEEEGIFLWWDGSSPAYENWSSGEPNNMGDEDCTELILWGQWNDIRCDDARAVLCRDPVSPLSPESN